MHNTLHYATTNSGKFEEVQHFFTQTIPHITIKQLALDVEEVQNTDQKYIAIDKAQKAWLQAKVPLLIDDAAIYFEKYNLFPGTLSKFISQGLGFEGLKKIISPGDRATFLLYLIFITGPEEYQIFEGRCDGKLIIPEYFDAHPSLPYDAFFVPDGETTKTYAQLRGTPDATQYLYRIRALKKFLDWYQNKV